MAHDDNVNNVLSAIDGLISSFNILKLASNITGFRKWLEDYHKINKVQEFLPGYKYLLNLILKCFISDIYTNNSLKLTDDYILYRAKFVGVHIQDIPNTCEKTILFKRIWNHSKAISKARSWENLVEITNNTWTELEVFNKILEKNCDTKSIFKKEYVLDSITIDKIFTYFNDTHHYIPLADLSFPSIEFTMTEKSLEKAFPGYVYGLQYLWYSILGSDEFERTCVKDLHLVLDENELDKHLQYVEKSETLPFLDESDSVKIIDEADLDDDIKEIIEGLKHDAPPRSQKWAVLDRFYNIIRDEIFRPREEALQISLGLSHLLVLKGHNKKIFTDLLNPSKVANPDYLVKKDKKSINKQLSLAMFWYSVNVLDTQSMQVFNGVPAFASTTIGLVELKKALHSKDDVKAIIFKHPAGLDGHFTYSFGVLIEAYGSISISDYSGWLIFYNCATNDSGFGSSQLVFAQSILDLAKKRGPISIEEVIVDEDLFKNYLTEHSIASVFNTLIKQTPIGTRKIESLDTIQIELKDYLGHSKGKLLEYLVEKWIRESRSFAETKCDIWYDGEQFDCISNFENTTSFFECKLNLHGDSIVETINQINRKIKILSKKYTSIEANLVIYEQVNPKNKSSFEENGVFVIDDFRSVIQQNKCFNKTRKEIFNILDWEFHATSKLMPNF
jgi:hypothetical protein